MKIPTFARTLAYATGKTIYCRIFVHNTEWAWDISGKYMTPVPVYADTAIACPEAFGKNVYTLTLPEQIPTGDYDLLFFDQVGGSPAATDTLVAAMRHGHIKRD